MAGVRARSRSRSAAGMSSWLHYWTGDPDLDIAEAVGEAYIDFLNDTTNDGNTTPIKQYQPSSMAFVGITGAQVDVDPSPVVEWQPSSPVAMTGTNIAPPQLALVLSKRTGLAGRSFRGRTYLGPWAPLAVGNNAQAASGLTENIVTRWMRHMANGTLPSSAVYNEVVWSRTLSQFNQITTWTCNAIFDTQRRRAFPQ